MEKKSLPESFRGYSTKELLRIWEELQTKEGTKASKEKIAAMTDLLREYKLGIFQIQRPGLENS